MIYRTFVMAGRMMTLVVDQEHHGVQVIVGRPATQAELDTEDYNPRYIPQESFV